MTGPVRFVPLSGNAKLGGMAATYAPITRTCPASCELRKDRTCYAMTGRVGMVARPLDDAAVGMRAESVARAEARAIDAAFGGGSIPFHRGRRRMLRLHVSGDARTAECARILARAADRWVARGGGTVYTYTHAWRDVPREAWGTVSVFASLDDPSDAPEALARGYAPATVVEAHTEARGRRAADGTVWVPCPNQTRGTTCADCGLCMRSGLLRAGGRGVTFAAHGVSRSRLKRRLAVVGGAR